MDGLEIIRALMALMMTLGLILVAAWAAKKYGLADGTIAARIEAFFGKANVTAPVRRLKLVEQLWLDAGKSRVVILSLDGAEHVLLLGPNGAEKLPISVAPAPLAPRLEPAPESVPQSVSESVPELMPALASEPTPDFTQFRREKPKKKKSKAA